jgi:hypothetical protein
MLGFVRVLRHGERSSMKQAINTALKRPNNGIRILSLRNPPTIPPASRALSLSMRTLSKTPILTRRIA